MTLIQSMIPVIELTLSHTKDPVLNQPRLTLTSAEVTHCIGDWVHIERNQCSAGLEAAYHQRLLHSNPVRHNSPPIDDSACAFPSLAYDAGQERYNVFERVLLS